MGNAQPVPVAGEECPVSSSEIIADGNVPHSSRMPNPAKQIGMEEEPRLFAKKRLGGMGGANTRTAHFPSHSPQKRLTPFKSMTASGVSTPGLTDYYASPSTTPVAVEYAMQQDLNGGAISPLMVYQTIEGHLSDERTAVKAQQ